jgi:hypothetical protein
VRFTTRAKPCACYHFQPEEDTAKHVPGVGTPDFGAQNGSDSASKAEDKAPEQNGFYGLSAAAYVGRITPANLAPNGKFSVRVFSR